MRTLLENKNRINDHRILLTLLLFPAVLLVSLFIIYPVTNTLFYSVYKWNGLGPMDKFVGIDNFIKLFQDDIFWFAIKNNVILVIFSLIAQLPVALILAIILNKRINKSIIIFRTIFFLPFVFSEIITGVIWRFIYDPLFGLIRYLQPLFFPGVEYNGLLSDPDAVFIAVMFVIFWKYFGFHMVIMIAGLQSIPEEYYEAARIDGANWFQQLWYITVPQLRSALRISIFFCVVGSFQIFDVVWVMSRGGPIHKSEVMVTYLIKFGLKRMKFGYGSAVGLVLFAICLVFSLFYQKAFKEKLD